MGSPSIATVLRNIPHWSCWILDQHTSKSQRWNKLNGSWTMYHNWTYRNTISFSFGQSTKIPLYLPISSTRQKQSNRWQWLSPGRVTQAAISFLPTSVCVCVLKLVHCLYKHNKRTKDIMNTSRMRQRWIDNYNSQHPLCCLYFVKTINQTDLSKDNVIKTI